MPASAADFEVVDSWEVVLHGVRSVCERPWLLDMFFSKPERERLRRLMSMNDMARNTNVVDMMRNTMWGCWLARRILQDRRQRNQVPDTIHNVTAGERALQQDPDTWRVVVDTQSRDYATYDVLHKVTVLITVATTCSVRKDEWEWNNLFPSQVKDGDLSSVIPFVSFAHLHAFTKCVTWQTDSLFFAWGNNDPDHDVDRKQHIVGELRKRLEWVIQPHYVVVAPSATASIAAAAATAAATAISAPAMAASRTLSTSKGMPVSPPFRWTVSAVRDAPQHEFGLWAQRAEFDLVQEDIARIPRASRIGSRSGSRQSALPPPPETIPVFYIARGVDQILHALIPTFKRLLKDEAAMVRTEVKATMQAAMACVMRILCTLLLSKRDYATARAPPLAFEAVRPWRGRLWCHLVQMVEATVGTELDVRATVGAEGGMLGFGEDAVSQLQALIALLEKALDDGMAHRFSKRDSHQLQTRLDILRARRERQGGESDSQTSGCVGVYDENWQTWTFSGLRVDLRSARAPYVAIWHGVAACFPFAVHVMCTPELLAQVTPQIMRQETSGTTKALYRVRSALASYVRWLCTESEGVPTQCSDSWCWCTRNKSLGLSLHCTTTSANGKSTKAATPPTAESPADSTQQYHPSMLCGPEPLTMFSILCQLQPGSARRPTFGGAEAEPAGSTDRGGRCFSMNGARLQLLLEQHAATMRGSSSSSLGDEAPSDSWRSTASSFFLGSDLAEVKSAAGMLQPLSLDASVYGRLPEWSAVYTEGRLWSAMLTLLCYDVLFQNPNSPYSPARPYHIGPLDLYSGDYRRDPYFRERMRELREEWTRSDIAAEVRTRYEELAHSCVRQGFSPEFFSSEQLAGIAAATGGCALAMILEQLVADYETYHNGLPDLVFWRRVDEHTLRKVATATGDGQQYVFMVEVKSQNDRLSAVQKDWLHTLTKHVGISVALCELNDRILLDDSGAGAGASLGVGDGVGDGDAAESLGGGA